MCGIAGVVHLDGETPVDPRHLDLMADALRHRGPDSGGELVEGSVGLTMRRLAVIDLSTGDQPIWNEDRSVAVVQNGEIFNFRDLRQDLTSRGHSFATTSDTEAIVHLYEEAGPAPELAAGLWGMFSFALLDRKRHVVVLARDRAGKKPLFLYRGGGVMAFASELHALARVPLIRDALDVDPGSLDAYLALQYVPGPRTIFRRVQHLPPGSLLVLERAEDGWREHEPRRYWSLREAPGTDRSARAGFGDMVAHCESILQDAVRRRLVSDVPLGVFLSGGVDSSLVVALMAQAAPDRVRTFSIGFSQEEYDESAAAALVAAHLGTEHRSLEMPAPTAAELYEILGALDQPLADPAVVPTWYLARMAREDVTVALSGEGADEVFAGYHWYRRAARRGLQREDRAGISPDDYYGGRVQIPGPDRSRLIAEAMRAGLTGEDAGRTSYRDAGAEAGDLPPMARLQAIDFHTWMADDLLVKVDRMSMAHSLEVRCPYLDHRLVEAALPLPNRYKIRWGRRKAILRRIAARYLPEAIVRRKKHGFRVPVDGLLRTTLAELLADLTGADRLRAQGVLDPEGVSALIGRWRDHDPSLARRVWKLVCFQIWWESCHRPA